MIKRIAIGVGAGALLLTAVVAWFAWQALNPPLPTPLATHAGLPLTMEDGTVTTLGEVAMPARPTLVAYWASWCVPCQAEAKALAALRRQHGPDRLNLLYINIEPNDTRAMIDGFLRRADAVGLPALRGTADTLKAMGGTDMVTLPRAYLFDRAGQPTRAFVGFAEGGEEELKSKVEPLM